MSNRIVQINQETFLIDMELFGVKEVGAAYIIKGKKTCLIDSGMKKEAAKIVKALDSINLFPDILILTHSHFDHSQGTPYLKREAERRGKKLEIMAGEKGIYNLQDQSWNRIYAKGSYKNISDVKPLREREIIDLGGVKLEIFDFSGHSIDDIGIFDQKNRTIFTGDSLGYKIRNLMIPPFVAPFWSMGRFKNTIKKAQKINYEKICFAHFGSVEGKEARDFPMAALKNTEEWLTALKAIDSEKGLENLNFVAEQIIKRLNLQLPDLELCNPFTKNALSIFNFIKRVSGRKEIDVADLQIKTMLKWLIEGYKISKS